jgi:hypothetical protein
MGQPLSALLVRLRAVLENQAEALGADDFETVGRLSDERDQLVLALGQYGAADRRPGDREMLERISALDQRLIEQTRVSMGQTGHGLRDVHGGRRALTEYGRRGENLNRNMALLDQAR